MSSQDLLNNEHFRDVAETIVKELWEYIVLIEYQDMDLISQIGALECMDVI